MSKTPFVQNAAITAFAIAYAQAGLIQDEVFPMSPVATKLFAYNQYSKDEAMRAPETLVGRLGVPNQVIWSSTQLSSQCDDHALTTPVPVADLDAWRASKAAGLTGAQDPLMRNSELLLQTLLNRRELRCATLATTLTNYAVSNRDTLSGVGQWSDYTNSKPLTYLKRRFDKMILRPTHGAMSQEVFTTLSMHPEFVGAVYKNGTNAGSVSRQQMAEQLGLQDIFVGGAWLNTANPGQAPNITRVWGLDAVFFHRNGAAGLDAGMTFGLTADFGGRFGGTWMDPEVGAKGAEIVKVGNCVKELMLVNDAGFLVKNAVAAT
jgi:hypothetical protein